MKDNVASQNPRRPRLGRRLAKVSVWLAGTMVGLGSGTWGLHSCAAADCWETGSDTPSPSGNLIARASTSGCPSLGGDTISVSVTLRAAGAPVSAGRDVFVADSVEPTVSWEDDRHLIIMLPGVSEINKSDLRHGNVRIIYKAPFDYSETHLREAEDKYKRQMEAGYGAKFAQSMVNIEHERDQLFRAWAMRTVAP
jgi:hypothetical protein